jgi:hypothetical protein
VGRRPHFHLEFGAFPTCACLSLDTNGDGIIGERDQICMIEYAEWEDVIEGINCFWSWESATLGSRYTQKLTFLDAEVT